MGEMVHTFNPRTPEAEAGRSPEFQANLGHTKKPSQKANQWNNQFESTSLVDLVLTDDIVL